MRDPDRIDIVLDRLGTLWRAVPDWRLAQVVVNAVNVTAPQVFYRDDDELLAGLDRLIAQYAPSPTEGTQDAGDR